MYPAAHARQVAVQFGPQTVMVWSRSRTRSSRPCRTAQHQSWRTSGFANGSQRVQTVARRGGRADRGWNIPLVRFGTGRGFPDARTDGSVFSV